MSDEVPNEVEMNEMFALIDELGTEVPIKSVGLQKDTDWCHLVDDFHRKAIWMKKIRSGEQSEAEEDDQELAQLSEMLRKIKEVNFSLKQDCANIQSELSVTRADIKEAVTSSDELISYIDKKKETGVKLQLSVRIARMKNTFENRKRLLLREKLRRHNVVIFMEPETGTLKYSKYPKESEGAVQVPVLITYEEVKELLNIDEFPAKCRDAVENCDGNKENECVLVDDGRGDFGDMDITE